MNALHMHTCGDFHGSLEPRVGVRERECGREREERCMLRDPIEIKSATDLE